MHARAHARISALALALACALAGTTFAQTAETATQSADPAQRPASIELEPGEYLWMPELAPRGPVLIVISLPEQLAYVYRNGVRIGVSTVSTGKPGYETPTGVFTILQKHREHYSNIYDNAPMPFMQRLTWDGVALHAGKVPGYPASHGCVRLPYAFSEKLFGITAQGMTVVVASDASHAPTVAYPGLFAPVDSVTGGAQAQEAPPTQVQSVWTPERAPDGPLTVVLSTRDHEVVVLRNAVEIGHAKVDFIGEPPRGTQAYVLLEGSGEGTSALLPDRQALRWLAVQVPPRLRGEPGDENAGDLRQAIAAGRLRVDPTFAHLVYDQLRPGATVVVTDEALGPRAAPAELTVLRADEAASETTVAAPPATPPADPPNPSPPRP